MATRTLGKAQIVGDGKKSAKLVMKTIEVPALDKRTMHVTVIGETPLITHQWSVKARQQIKDKQAKAATKPREAKDPQAEFESSIYRLPDGRSAIKASSFKLAAVSAASLTGLRTRAALGGFFVIGDLLPIEGSKPQMREDMVRVGKFPAVTTDIRYRAEFWPWKVKLTITYNAGLLSPAQIVNLLNHAGFSIGVGEWRPEKRGTFGMFHVGTAEES